MTDNGSELLRETQEIETESEAAKETYRKEEKDIMSKEVRQEPFKDE